MSQQVEFRVGDMVRAKQDGKACTQQQLDDFEDGYPMYKGDIGYVTRVHNGMVDIRILRLGIDAPEWSMSKQWWERVDA